MITSLRQTRAAQRKVLRADLLSRRAPVLACIFGLPAAVLLMAAVMTPCWTSRSYLLFDIAPDVSTTIPDVTVCWGLDSSQISQTGLAGPDSVRSTYPDNAGDYFNLGTFKDNAAAPRGLAITATVLAFVSLLTTSLALSSVAPAAHAFWRRLSSFCSFVAGVFAIFAGTIWAVRAPSSQDWPAVGFPAASFGSPYYSHYFNNGGYSLIMAMFGGAASLVMALVAGFLVPRKFAPLDVGEDEQQLLQRAPGGGVQIPYPGGPALMQQPQVAYPGNGVPMQHMAPQQQQQQQQQQPQEVAYPVAPAYGSNAPPSAPAGGAVEGAAAAGPDTGTA